VLCFEAMGSRRFDFRGAAKSSHSETKGVSNTMPLSKYQILTVRAALVVKLENERGKKESSEK